MTAEKGPNLSLPQPATDPPANVNYRFFVKAICVNLCFMTAFTLFIIAIGIVFSLLSSTAQNANHPPSVQHPMEYRVPPTRSVSVQHFEHIVQNGNQMANQIRYLVPEAQQMVQDSIRIFYEALFKVNSILLPDPPQVGEQLSTPIETETTTTEIPDILINREKREVSQDNLEDKPSNLATLMDTSVKNSCPSALKTDRDKRAVDDFDFNPLDLDPLNLQILGDPDFLGDIYDDDQEENWDSKVRKKRYAQMKYQQLKEEFVRCKKNTKNNEKCGEIYNEVVKMLNNLKDNIHSVQDLLGKGKEVNPKLPPSYKDSRPSELRSLKVSELNPPEERTGGSTIGSRLQDPEAVSVSRVGFHEDMEDPSGQSRQWIDSSKFINQLTNQKIHNIAPSNKFVPTTLVVNQRQQNDGSSKLNSQSEATVNKNIPGQSEFVAGSGPFLTLCDQYARSNLNPLNNANNQNGQNQNSQTNQNQQQNQLNIPNQPSFIGFTSWSPQFTNRGPGGASIPMTGESMHSTAKVLINPGECFTIRVYPASYSCSFVIKGVMGVGQNPVCFTAVPVQQRLNGNVGFLPNTIQNNNNKQGALISYEAK